MQADVDSVVLTASQAACLDALRSGVDGKTKIAIVTRRDLKTVGAALDGLQTLRLIEKFRRYGWRTTGRGQSCPVEVTPDPARRLGRNALGRPADGSSAERLVEALDRPMRGRELAEHLGVTRQRVHQLVVGLHAQGRLRLGDPDSILHIVARAEDPSVLLSRDEERVLSAMPDGYPTSMARIREASAVQAERTTAAMAKLRAEGLTEDAAGPRGGALYRLTPAGLAHPQRGAAAARAQPPPLPVRSDRVLGVLSHIAERGEVRIIDIGVALEIPHQSTNALLQYLKRKGLVEKTGRDLKAPYALTDAGHGALAELIRKRG